MEPQTKFASVGNERVAYQVLGDGPRDLLHTIGLWSQVDVILEDPSTLRYRKRLASVSCVILFDARGSGRSDPRFIADRIAGAHFVELPGADGLPIWEGTDEILGLIEEFLTGTHWSSAAACTSAAWSCASTVASEASRCTSARA